MSRLLSLSLVCVVASACVPPEPQGPPGTRTVHARSKSGDHVSVSLSGKDDAYTLRVDGREAGKWNKRGEEWVYSIQRAELVVHAGGDVAVAGCATSMKLDRAKVIDRANGSTLYELQHDGTLAGPIGEKYGLSVEPYDGDPTLGFLLILPLIHVISREGDAASCPRDPKWPG
jgi:hypothetical protein